MSNIKQLLDKLNKVRYNKKIILRILNNSLNNRPNEVDTDNSLIKIRTNVYYLTLL